MRYYINVSFQILLSLLIVLINLLLFIQAIEYESNVKVKFSYPLSGSTLAKGTIYFNVFHPLQKLPEFLKSSEKPGGNEKLRYLIQFNLYQMKVKVYVLLYLQFLILILKWKGHILLIYVYMM